MAKKLDAIIFGATGFAGRIVVEQALDMLKGFSWGIAGRNEHKLRELLQEIGAKTKNDTSQIPIIIADVGNETSIENMAKKCKIILNCCGPYRIYGEIVVRACANHGTHHVDISGEPQYFENMQLLYNDLAQETGSYIVSTCATESVPADMAVVYLAKNFAGTINSVEMFSDFTFNYKDPTSKAILNSGTWDSAIYAMQHVMELIQIQIKRNREEMPSLSPKLWIKPLPRKTEGLQNYFVPFFVSPDPTVVQRSQQLFYRFEKKRPIQFQTYLGLNSLCWAMFFPFYLMILGIMSQMKCTRNLLIKYPKFFSFGLMCAEGPLEENRKALEFSMTFKAKGWSDQDSTETTSPDKELTARISGKDPCYGCTATILLSCAKTILLESQKMPGNGGVLPPGVAFAKTKLIEELGSGTEPLKFEILKK